MAGNQLLLREENKKFQMFLSSLKVILGSQYGRRIGSKERRGHMFSILVAEDDRNLNRMICAKLKQERYHAFPAFDGEEALEMLLLANRF